MHGLAEGRVRGNKDTPAIEAFDGPDDSYPDGGITAQALRDLDALAAADAPFLLAVGLIRPHLPFGAPKRYLDLYDDVELPPIPHPQRPEGRTTWHGSGEFINNYVHDGRDPRRDPAYADLVRRHYAACVSYADALVGQLLDRVDHLGLADDTVVVLWGDHGWHLGEHGIWGKHSLFEESLRAPLIVRAPGRPAPGTPSAAVVQSIDLFPTLCELCAVPVPDGLDGRSLVPQLDDPLTAALTAGLTAGGAAVSYSANADTLRTARYRLVRHRARGDAAAFVELYDHSQPVGETANVAAQHPTVVAGLLAELDALLR